MTTYNTATALDPAKISEVEAALFPGVTSHLVANNKHGGSAKLNVWAEVWAYEDGVCRQYENVGIALILPLGGHAYVDLPDVKVCWVKFHWFLLQAAAPIAAASDKFLYVSGVKWDEHDSPHTFKRERAK